MDTDEEYLDDLLESMTSNEQQNRTMKDAMRDVKRISNEVKEITRPANIPEIKSDTVSSDSDDWRASLDDILAQVDMQDEADESGNNDLTGGNLPQENIPAQTNDLMQANDFTQDDLADLIDSMDSMALDTRFEDDEMDEELADLFKQNFDAGSLKSAYTDSNLEDGGSQTREPAGDNSMDTDLKDKSSGNVLNMEKMDVTDLIDNMDGADADLAEINGLLKTVERNESVNDDILELLESVRADSSEDGDDSAFDIFDEHELREVLRDGSQYINSAEELESIPEKDSKKKKRKKKEKKKKEKSQNEGGLSLKEKLFGRRKKAKDTDEDDQLSEDNGAQGKAVAVEGGQEDDIREKDEKKPGFFSKLKELLKEEEDQPLESKDGAEVLKEIDEAEREEIKKAAQKKKEKKEKKGNKKEKAASKKPEKKKKAKKEKKPREVVVERPILSKKVLILLVALCATLLASIFILSSLLPEYEQRQRVRAAYQERDYETVYKFLYNKKRNSNETIMYDRAELIFKLERKWKSYQNNMLLNQELEALHALMEGVDYYRSLTGTVEYETQVELDRYYQLICASLSGYGITPEEAVEINAYDDVTYTKRLTALVNGTEFTAPGEEGEQEPLSPQDVLPEEEEIMGIDSDN